MFTAVKVIFSQSESDMPLWGVVELSPQLCVAKYNSSQDEYHFAQQNITRIANITHAVNITRRKTNITHKKPPDDAGGFPFTKFRDSFGTPS